MAANAARQTEMRQGADDGALAVFDRSLAAADDVSAAFAALAARGRGLGFDALLCRRHLGEAAAPQDLHTLPQAIAGLFASAGFRRSWPVERAALAAALPQRWTTSDWPGDQGAAARVAMGRLAEAGVEAGVTLSVHGPRGLAMVLTGLCNATRLDALAIVDLDLWSGAAVRFLARTEDLTARPVATPLSRREMEILALSAEGLTAATAARALGVTEATIKFHLTGARRKLGVRNTAEAVARLHVLKERQRQ